MGGGFPEQFARITEHESMNLIEYARLRATRAAALAAIVTLAAAALAQQQMGLGGGALDANLGVNSGGYNRAVVPGAYSSPGFSNARYVPGVTRGMYGYQSSGGTVYNSQVAGSMVQQRYSPAGYAGYGGYGGGYGGPAYVSPGWQMQRYRYQ
jgi:hypothetical protein